MSAAVTHDPGLVLALDIAIDAGHVGSDLVHQHTLAQSQNVIGPFVDGGGWGFDPRQAALGCEPDHASDPLDTVFRGARVIAQPGMRTHGHQHVAEIALPLAEPRRAVELFPEGFALLRCHLERLARVGPVDVAARRLATARQDLRIIEPDVAAQVELVRDMVQIALGVRLRREVLVPVPLLEQLLRERVTVGPALRVETRARIAVPVPGAADPAASFKDPDPQAELAQLVELIEASDANADDERIELGGGVDAVLPRL